MPSHQNQSWFDGLTSLPNRTYQVPTEVTEAAMQGTRAEFGVNLSEAYKRFCRSDIWEEYVRTGSVARTEVVQDVSAKLCDGRLVAIGFVVGPKGRDPDAGRRRIPEDFLRSRNCRFNSKDETISGNGLSFVDVRVGPTFEAPEAVAELVGRSLAECFEKVVTEDWLRREMEEPVFRRFPGWKMVSTNTYFLWAGRWPVRFEDWADPAFHVGQMKSPIFLVEGTAPVPPDEVVPVWKRIAGETQRLIAWLRDGTLVAEGAKEPPDHALTREPIVGGWWARADVEMDVIESALWKGPPNRDEMIFSDIKIVAHVAADKESIDDQSQEKPQRAKGRPGRKPVWNWNGALREFNRLKKLKRGLPRPQRAIEDRIKDWFVRRHDNHPSESSIREFVVENLPSDYNQN